MRKIPVGKTIADAYSYALEQFPANLGITWLPLFVLFGAMAFLFPLYFGAIGGLMTNIQATQPGQPPAMPDLSGMMRVYQFALLFYLLEIAMLAQIALGMTRRALGMQQGPVFVFFSVGKTYWQLVGAYLIMLVLQFVVVFAVEIAALILGAIMAVIGVSAFSGGHAAGASAAGIILGVLMTVAVAFGAIFAVIYIMARMTFLLTPAIVAEKRFAIFRSWELTQGNFWRMFVVGLAVFGPLLILLAIFYSFLVSLMLPSLAGLSQSAGANDPQAAVRAMSVFMGTMTNVMRQYWYVIGAVSLLVSAVTYGLMLGAAASAYRSQTEETLAPAAFA